VQKKMVDKETPEVWDTLDEVVSEYPIMLNRAPTLHRLGIQAFEPTLIEGKAIQLHPLVCTAFNADFDGDQMAVHIPLAVESQIEARILMLSSNNILSPANGSPIVVPTQDIVLGIYYMTRSVNDSKGAWKEFCSLGEVRAAYDAEAIDLHAPIKVRIQGKMHETTVGRVLLYEIMPQEPLVRVRHIGLFSAEEANEILKMAKNEDQSFLELCRNYSRSRDRLRDGDLGILRRDELQRLFRLKKSHASTIMKLSEKELSDVIVIKDEYHIFEMLEKRFEIPYEYVNHVMDKKRLRELVDYAYRTLGAKSTVILSDRIKDLGYEYATIGGVSISIDDMIVPSAKWNILSEAEAEVNEIESQYNEGLITQGEKYNKVVDIWSRATDNVANAMMGEMKNQPVLDDNKNPIHDENSDPVYEDSFNAIYMMADSGSRGSKDQMRQLAGMRGLMAKPSGEIIETPITANFREGLSVLQYFISTHGARKGLADTALKTANSGYLTRRLADVAQDCIVSEVDCGSVIGVEVEPLMEGGEIIQRLGERLLGRTSVEDIMDPFTDEIIVKAGDEIDETCVRKIENAGFTRIKIRSVLTCRTDRGVCAKCYGRDLAHGHLVEIGQAVGILAAQSIGEPGTQLTMRTFHIGGTASRRVEQADIRAHVEGNVRFVDLNVVHRINTDGSIGDMVVMNRRGGEFVIESERGRERERCPVIYGAQIKVKDGQLVKPGDVLAAWDPFTTPILTEVSGVVKFDDIFIGKTMQEKVDPVTGKSSQTIVEFKEGEVRPRISIKDKSGKTARLKKLETKESTDGSGLARYYLPVDAILLVEEGDSVNAGDIIAKLPRATTKTKDITGGLPRVAELFEVRKPKENAVLSEIDGYVSISKGAKGKQKITVTPVDVGDKKEYLISRGKHINVYDGDYVRSGDPFNAGVLFFFLISSRPFLTS
jgi:DNA-directed RNA polymerase subunit beta'